MLTILVRLRIPVSSHYDRPAPLVFTQWLPLDDLDALVVRTNGMKVKVWLDTDCLAHVADIPTDEIEKHVNLMVGAVYMDVSIEEVQDELTAFIYKERDRFTRPEEPPTDAEYQRLSKQYRELGEKVLIASLGVWNRIIAFFRTYKGQYWLEERPLEVNMLGSRFTEFGAKVRSDNYDWVRWCPPAVDTITVHWPERERFLEEGEWLRVGEFIRSTARPNLALELLANAERLESEGYGRSALIEAVSALEVAFSHFARTADVKELLSAGTVGRVDVGALESQTRHLGFSGSLRYLIPLLFPADILSDPLLSKCFTALKLRGNVIHSGQREVGEDELRDSIRAIRETCKILQRYTK